MNKTFIGDCQTLLDSLPALTGDNARVAHRLCRALNRLENIINHAEAQFKVGDSYATFNRQSIEALNKP